MSLGAQAEKKERPITNALAKLTSCTKLDLTSFSDVWSADFSFQFSLTGLLDFNRCHLNIGLPIYEIHRFSACIVFACSRYSDRMQLQGKSKACFSHVRVSYLTNKRIPHVALLNVGTELLKSQLLV